MRAAADRPLSDSTSIEELKEIRRLVDGLLARAQVSPVGVEPPPNRRPSQKLRIAAARLRVSSDRQVGRVTPKWIRDLASRRRG